MRISLAQRLAVAGTLPCNMRHAGAAVRIGFLAPLGGPSSPWGAPGLEGCQIWADWVNEQGGLRVGPRRHQVKIFARVAAIGPEQTRLSAMESVERAGVKVIRTLGGDSLAPALPWLMSRGVLAMTLLPFDLSPETPSLIAPVEVHPIFVVTAAEWLAAPRPDLGAWRCAAERTCWADRRWPATAQPAAAPDAPLYQRSETLAPGGLSRSFSC